MRTSLMLVLLVLLAGCAPQTLLVKDGMTQQQFEADKFDCEQKVVTMYGGYTQMGVGHAIMARQDMERCMTALKGYRVISTADADAAHKAEADRIRAENARRAAETNANASEAPTLNDTPSTPSIPCLRKACPASSGY